MPENINCCHVINNILQSSEKLCLKREKMIEKN